MRNIGGSVGKYHQQDSLTDKLRHLQVTVAIVPFFLQESYLHFHVFLNPPPPQKKYCTPGKQHSYDAFWERYSS